jgi:hypothetical protein
MPKIHIEPNEWFVPIEKAYPSLLSEYNRLELDKTLDNTRRNEQYAQIILSWCAVVEEVRTVFMELNDTSIYIPVLSVSA